MVAKLEEVGNLEAARSLWSGLDVRNLSPFTTWEWASTWYDVFGEGRRVRVLACRNEDSQVIGLVPLYEQRRWPVRLLRFLGHGPGERLGPICAPEHRSDIADAWTRWLARQPAGTIVIGDHVPRCAGWCQMLDAVPLRLVASPVVEIPPGGWDEYVADRSSNMRSQIRRKRRRLERRFDVDIELASDTAGVDRAYSLLVALHHARWGSSGSGAFGGRRFEFHRRFCDVALEQGWLRLWTVRLDGRPAAAYYGFRFGRSDWYYQSGRDPKFGDDSIGFVMLCHVIEDAARAGQATFELLRGDETYKSRFATSDDELETFAFGSGALTSGAVSATSSLLSVPAIRRVAVTRIGR